MGGRVLAMVRRVTAGVRQALGLVTLVALIAGVSASLTSRTAAQRERWPSPRARHHMVYHAAMKQVLLYGGAQPRRPDGAAPDNAIWTWNGTIWQSHSSTLPLRANEAVAYAPERDRLIVHGGSDVGDETWEWDQRTWRLVASAGPGARGHHALTYDPIRKHVVLFGNNDRTPTTDTWGWDGVAWKKLAAEGPPARGVFGAAFDAKRGVMVVFGGCCAPGVGLVGDTWEWDGTHWNRIATPSAPAPRLDTSMAYDPGRDRIVLFGGTDRSTNLADTWEYDGRTWTKVDLPGPSARNGAAMIYDPRAKAILLFGGRGETYVNDFWTFDGAWRRLPQTP
jgi:hypothetical protein